MVKKVDLEADKPFVRADVLAIENSQQRRASPSRLSRSELDGEDTDRSHSRFERYGNMDLVLYDPFEAKGRLAGRGIGAVAMPPADGAMSIAPRTSASHLIMVAP